MKKLILGPPLILGIPQILVSLFFLFVKMVLGWPQEAREWYVGVTGVTLLGTLLVTAACLFGPNDNGWIDEYLEEQKCLREERERLRQKLEEEIGIPRVK